MGVSCNKGFEIAVDVKHHVLRCRLWGIWDLDLAKKYKYALMEKITEIHGNGEAWCAFADFTAFYPSSEDVQSLIRDYLAAAKTQGMKQIVYIGDNPAIRRRLDRIFPGYGNERYMFAESDEQAMQWLLNRELK